MPSAHFQIQLQQPAIFTLQSGTSGTPQSLDFIPGATLLGHVAARLYARLSPDQAWLIFHSGKVRFGDAQPMINGQPTYPMPLSWHVVKGDAASSNGILDAQLVFDPAHSEQSTRQPKQLRSGHITFNGHLARPSLQQTLKTAIDPATGTAAESQLFGYEALTAGQRFACSVRADDDVPTELWQRITAALQGSAMLGRSRSAQFGAAEISPLATAPETAPGNDDQWLTLWLLSDLALERDGQPCLEPQPELLGLPEGSRWEMEKSFLRMRSYSPYNAYRRHHDVQRQVITRGSVLRYKLPRPLTAEELDRLQQGLGLHVEAGLGCVWANPPLLAGAHPTFAATPASTCPSEERTTKATPTASAFLRALAARQHRVLGDDTEFTARRILEAYRDNVQAALRFGGAVEPPGRSQWGRLKQLASDYRHSPDKLAKALFDGESGVLRPRSGWELRFGTGANDTLGKWLEGELPQDAKLPELLGQLAALLLHQAGRIEGQMP